MIVSIVLFVVYLFVVYFRIAVGIVHRMLCYQKRCKVRLTYKWKLLWSGKWVSRSYVYRRLRIF